MDYHRHLGIYGLHNQNKQLIDIGRVFHPS